MPRRLPEWLIALIVVVIGGSWIFGITNVAGWADFFLFSRNRADVAFRIQYSDRMSFVAAPFAQAGASKGDRVLAIDGQQFTGFAQEFKQIRGHKGGDRYTIRVQKADGRVQDITAPLPRLHPENQKPNYSLFAVALLLQIVFPIFCLGLGTWVLLARPQDANAWYVFAILHFVQTFFGRPESFSGPAFIFMTAWSDLWQGLFLVAVFFFGLDFPQRFAWERNQPWARWALAGPVLLTMVPDPFELYARLCRVDLFRPAFEPIFTAMDSTQSVLGVACISIFCAVLVIKLSTATSSDARRRLRVLVIGSQMGLWPTFLILIISKIRGVQFDSAVPFWIFIASLLLFMLFPLSLAYAIVVERAMDVRILLRQGTQYALARSSVVILRLLVSAFLGFTIFESNRHWISQTRSIVQTVIAVGLLLLTRSVLEKRARLWIDRKFFRESYASEQVLSDLIADISAGELSGDSMRLGNGGELLETVSRRISDTLHVENMVMLLRTGNGFRLQTATGVEVPSNFLLGDASQSITALESRRGPATVYFDRPDDWLMDASDAERAALRELNVEVLLPLPGRRRLMGVMALGPKRSEQPYSKADLQLLTSVGTQTGLALENNDLIATLTTEVAQRERMNRELEIAHEVQERLFPQTFPHMAGVQVTGSCRPAQGVGGDYYDCMITGAGRLALAIGDVSGKGISAALLMASLRASLRGQTMQGATDLAQVVANVNSLLYESSASNRYATFFFGEYDPGSRKIFYVNAGHNPPVLIRSRAGESAELHTLTGGGPVVGLLAIAEYEQCELQMQPGDLLLLYTDGISEAMDVLDEEWGEDRMVAEAERLSANTAQGVLDGLVNAADAFAAGAEQHDDMTLMVMKLE